MAMAKTTIERASRPTPSFDSSDLVSGQLPALVSNPTPPPIHMYVCRPLFGSQPDAAAMQVHACVGIFRASSRLRWPRSWRG